MKYGDRFRVFSALALFLFCTSCASRHWIVPAESDLEQGDTVYGLVTASGDTLYFAGHSCDGERRSTLFGGSYLEFEGRGGVFDGSVVSGVDAQGDPITVPFDDLELAQVPSSAIILLSLGAFVLVLATVATIAESDRYSYPVICE